MINAQTFQVVAYFQTTLTQITVNLSQQKSKFPTSSQQNPKWANENFEVQNGDCKVVMALRSKNGYERPKLPLFKESNAKDEPTLDKNARSQKD